MSTNGQTPNGDGPDRSQVPRRLRTQHNVRLAVIVLAISSVGIYLGFTKDVPFTGGYQVKAVFTSANSIRPDSPVRIAGVNVGKVLDVARYKDTSSALVTMEIDDNGLPMHKDATMKIRPRIFLEGNFFVDATSGTPASPELKDGDILPVTQTSTPVQLDQVLTSLQYSSREDLQNLLQGLGTALDSKPTPAENAQLPAEVQDTTGGEALNKSLKYTPQALKGTAIVNQGFLGEHPGDLGKFVKGLGATTAQLSANESDLAGFVTNFSHTMQALGSNPAALQQSIALLGPTVNNTYNALGSVNAALPSLSAFSLALIPAAEETPATVAVGTPWAKEAAIVLDKNHLQATMKLLQPITAATAQTVAQQIQILPQTKQLAQCFFYKILPTGDQKISDSGTGYDFSTNQEAYKEFWFALVGMAGESQNYDGNGQFIRAQTGGAQQTRNSSTGGNLQLALTEVSGQANLKSPVWGNMPNPPLGTSPRYFGRDQQPRYSPTTNCVDPTNPVTSTVNLNDATAAKGAADTTGSPG